MIISSFEIRLVCRIHSLTILVSQLLVGILNFTFSHFPFYCLHTILSFFFADRWSCLTYFVIRLYSICDPYMYFLGLRKVALCYKNNVLYLSLQCNKQLNKSQLNTTTTNISKTLSNLLKFVTGIYILIITGTRTFRKGVSSFIFSRWVKLKLLLRDWRF